MLLLELPGFSIVMSLLPSPDERVGLDVIERPTYRRTVGSICTTKNDTIAFQSSLNSDDVVELRTYEDDAPLFESSIKESNRGANSALLLAICRVANKEVLHRATIQDPTDQQLALGMSNGAIIAIEAIVAVPGTHEPVEHLRLVSQRRMGARSSKRLDHILSWIGTLGGGVPKQEPQHACCCNRTENPANCATL